MNKTISNSPALGFIRAAVIMLASLTACTSALTPNPMTTPTSSTALEGEVEVWLTLPGKTKLLHRETNARFEAGAGSGAQVIRLNPQITFQIMEGAGAAMTDSSAWLLMNKLTEAQRDEVMRNLFTREGDGISINYLRLPMGASDFALEDYSYDDVPGGGADPELKYFSIEHDQAYIIPSLQQALALNPQLRFMGSPWSPPGWMKNGGSMHGGTLSSKYFQAFADYHVKFAQAYAAEGLPIDSLTVQNEPMYQTNNYPTMSMPAPDQQSFVRDYLGPALKAAGLKTRLLIFDHNWDMADYPLQVLNDPEAAQYVDGVAFHCYGGAVSAQSTVHDAFPDKGIWFTECSGGGWAPKWDDNISWNIRNLVIGNFRHWGNSVLLWNLALDENAGPQNGGCGNCRGVVTIDSQTGAVTYNEEYYILGHVTRFVDAGAVRIDSGENQPENVAFLNPDGSLVLIVHSTTYATFDVEWSGQHFTYRIPAGGTVTFKWDAS